jgi:hypothetical protein
VLKAHAHGTDRPLGGFSVRDPEAWNAWNASLLCEAGRIARSISHILHARISHLYNLPRQDAGWGGKSGDPAASVVGRDGVVAARGTPKPPLSAQATTGVRGALAQFPTFSAILECSPKVLQPSVVLRACGKHYLNRRLGGSRALLTH